MAPDIKQAHSLNRITRVCFSKINPKKLPVQKMKFCYTLSVVVHKPHLSYIDTHASALLLMMQTYQFSGGLANNFLGDFTKPT